MNRTKQTHTPGPWKASNTSDGWHISSTVDPGYFARIAGPCKAGTRDAEANARLIAEAPVMREALAELVMVARLHKLDTLAAVVNARAILARIEGGEDA